MAHRLNRFSQHLAVEHIQPYVSVAEDVPLDEKIGDDRYVINDDCSIWTS